VFNFYELKTAGITRAISERFLKDVLLWGCEAINDWPVLNQSINQSIQLLLSDVAPCLFVFNQTWEVGVKETLLQERTVLVMHVNV
jgi:hypothetical protein